jgi:hypothetical protein
MADAEKCVLKTAQYVHEIVLTLSRWAAANELNTLSDMLRTAAVEAADVYNLKLNAYEKARGRSAHQESAP